VTHQRLVEWQKDWLGRGGRVGGVTKSRASTGGQKLQGRKKQGVSVKRGANRMSGRREEGLLPPNDRQQKTKAWEKGKKNGEKRQLWERIQRLSLLVSLPGHGGQNLFNTL